MGEYVVRRLVQIPVTLLVLSAAVFVLVHLTGDPVDLYLPLEATPEQRLILRRLLGLDEPVIVQYFRFLSRAAKGDLGLSLQHGRPALHVALDHLPATMELAFASFALAAVVGLSFGLLAVAGRHTFVDRLILSASFAAQCVPGFWLGIVMIYLLAVRLQWLPTSGAGGLRYLIMPAVATAWAIAPRTVLLVRASLHDTLGEDYVRTARGKGLANIRILLKHVLRNSLIPIVTYLGLLLGRLMGGAVITETIFAWPGLGSVAVEAAFRRDMAIIQATTLLFAAFMLLLSLTADVINSLLDPRIS